MMLLFLFSKTNSTTLLSDDNNQPLKKTKRYLKSIHGYILRKCGHTFVKFCDFDFILFRISKLSQVLFGFGI